MKKIMCLLLFSVQSYLFPYQTDVHQDITSEAFYLLQYLYPGIELSELGLRFGEYGESQWSTGEVLAGVYREDLEDVVWGYGPESSFPLSFLFTSSPTATSTHFWIADNGDNENTPGVGWLGNTYPNAYQKALKYLNGGWKLLFLESGTTQIKEYRYNGLIQLAKTGIIQQTGYYTVPNGDYTSLNPIASITLNNSYRKRFVYEILGRLMHLLQDMSVPAHVHGDSHPDLSNSFFLPCFGMEWCEQSDDYENALTHSYVHNSWAWDDALDAGGLLINNDFFSNPIKFLFYTTNQIADFFPSDGSAGNHNLPMGTNNFISSVYNSFNNQCPTNIDAHQFGNVNYVTSIRATASLLFWYAYEMDYIKSITITSSKIDDFVQVRNPARSIPPYTSQYYWQPTPYTLKFDNSITVDLLADAYSGTHCFLDWVKRDRHNLTVGGTSELEWLNANALETSTFVANYAPWVTVSFAPIQIESATANAHYENISTGETGSSFTFPQGYPISVKAVAPQEYLFSSWSDGFIENPRSFNLNSNMTGIYATFKKIKSSDNSNAYANNSQRKFLRTSNGRLHSVYESMSKVWLETTTDNGITWTIQNNSPLYNNFCASPTMSIIKNNSINDFLVAYEWSWDENNTPTDIAINRISSSTGNIVQEMLAVEGSSLGSYRNPVISSSSSNYTSVHFILVFEIKSYDANNGYTPGIYWTAAYIPQGSNQFIWYNWPQFITGTNGSSYTPSIETNYNYGNQSCEYKIVWEQRTSTTASQIQSRTLSVIGTDHFSASLSSSTVPISDGSGYQKNYAPSLITLNNGIVKAVWQGARQIMLEDERTEAPQNISVQGNWEYKTVYKDLSSGTQKIFGTKTNPPAINKLDDNSRFFITYSEQSNLSGKFIDGRYMREISDLGITGKDIQTGNGSTTSNAYAMGFNSSNIPFYFSQSQPFVNLIPRKMKTLAIQSGREGVVYKDTAQFYFAVGDVIVDNQPVEFKPLFDTIQINTEELVNTFLETETFTLSDNSVFYYSVQYGITDSVAAVQVLSGNKSINFKVELIDALSGTIIGTFDNVAYSENNVFLYNNIAYQVNTAGVGNTQVKLRLVITTSGGFDYSLTERFAEETVLGKSSIKQINLDGSALVKEYALAQNFPNPFNPSTTIRYQIPKAGIVTLKIYDILGSEVATLVNAEKVAGKYEVNFNASTLASGVYIYKIQSGDFINSKKMLLLK